MTEGYCLVGRVEWMLKTQLQSVRGQCVGYACGKMSKVLSLKFKKKKKALSLKKLTF